MHDTYNNYIKIHILITSFHQFGEPVLYHCFHFPGSFSIYLFSSKLIPFLIYVESTAKELVEETVLISDQAHFLTAIVIMARQSLLFSHTNLRALMIMASKHCCGQRHQLLT